MPKMLIACYSASGHTQALAEAIAQGASQEGVEVVVRRVEECQVEELTEFDGLCLGSPTYFSNMAWPVKRIIDESIVLYRRQRALRDKVAGFFTSTGGISDGEKCLTALEWAMEHHRVRMVLPGLVLRSSASPQTVLARGKEYGRRIARALKAEIGGSYGS
jgi:multimeric flavodoxin WrbA